MSGWIKLHRELLDWEWYDDLNTSRLFIHLMLTANHKDNKWRGICIKRGSRLTSLDKLSSETNLSVSKIRTSIKKLISTNEISSKSHSQHTVFTMINYSKYQSDDKHIDKPLANETQANDKRIATNNNVKNDNNKINSIVLDSFDHWWGLYPVARRKNKSGCFKKWQSKCKNLIPEKVEELTNIISNDIKNRLENTEDLKYMVTTEPYLNQERWRDGE